MNFIQALHVIYGFILYQDLILWSKRMYWTFGLGSFHVPRACLQKEMKASFKGRDINLLRTSETQMAGFFYALHRMLILSVVLWTIVHSITWLNFMREKTRKEKALIGRAEDNKKLSWFGRRISFFLGQFGPPSSCCTWQIHKSWGWTRYIILCIRIERQSPSLQTCSTTKCS